MSCIILIPDLGEQIADGAARTTADGSLTIDISNEDILKQIDAENLQSLTLEATVVQMKMSCRSASAVQSSLHPASFYIGVRSEVLDAGRAGVEVRFSHPDHGLAEKALRWACFAGPVSEDHLGADGPGGLEFMGAQSPSASVHHGQQRRSGDGCDRAARGWLLCRPSRACIVLKVFGSGCGYRKDHCGWAAVRAAQWPNLPNQELPLTADKSAYQPRRRSPYFDP